MAYSVLMNKALFRLMAGFRRFKEKYYLHDEESSIYHRLATEGQSPKTLLIGCSDSRVDPAILGDASPGELFIVRNVANLVPPYEPSAVGFRGTSSALEFAVQSLKVENIIVLGHRQCGGVRALMYPAKIDPDSFVAHWMSIAEDARKVVLTAIPDADEHAQLMMCEMETLKISIRNLKTFPFVQEAIRDRGMSLIAVYFDLERGALWELDDTTNEFRQLEI